MRPDFEGCMGGPIGAIHGRVLALGLALFPKLKPPPVLMSGQTPRGYRRQNNHVASRRFSKTRCSAKLST
jgi:hypothetical protein